MSTIKYPIYVLSKGRYKNCLTAKFLLRDQIPFNLVVEEQEAPLYQAAFPDPLCTVLTLPFANKGAIPVRNWIWEDSIQNGHERHWCLDDNIREVRRLFKGKRIPSHCRPAFSTVETFTDRYENVGISGLNYQMFGMPWKMPPYFLNVHVYSFMLIKNDMDIRWRGEWNADTDLCLQALAKGYCTVLINAFLADKMITMKSKGGNTDRYTAEDGRLKMARALERVWPYVVETKRRFKRPQHVIRYNWRRFSTPLIRKEDIDWEALPANDELGMTLAEQSTVKSAGLSAMRDEYNERERHADDGKGA